MPATPDVAVATPPTTGAVLVTTYLCTNVPVDTSSYGWYSTCAMGSAHRYGLTPVAGAATDAHATDTANTGAATFLDLPPGRYDVNAAWCHAESDNVNVQGNVVVEANKETTVWFFYCEDDTGLSSSR